MVIGYVTTYQMLLIAKPSLILAKITIGNRQTSLQFETQQRFKKTNDKLDMRGETIKRTMPLATFLLFSKLAYWKLEFEL